MPPRRYGSRTSTTYLGENSRICRILILLDIRETLACLAGWPPDFDCINLCVLAQSNVLLQWQRTKRSAATNGSIDAGLRAALILKCNFGSSSNRRAISLYPDQFQAILVSRILKNPHGVGISWGSTSNHGNNIFESAVGQISKRNTVSSVPVAGPGCSCCVDERLPPSFRSKTFGTNDP